MQNYYWVRLFIDRSRKQRHEMRNQVDKDQCGRDVPSGTARSTGTPTKEQTGLHTWLKYDQNLHFQRLIDQIRTTGISSDKEFQSMYFEINEGILLIKGRIRRPGTPILHRDSLLAKLWLQHIHVNVLRHAGGSSTSKRNQCRPSGYGKALTCTVLQPQPAHTA